MIAGLFILLSSLVLYCSYWVRRKFSGKNYKEGYFLLCVVCNFPLGVFHLKIIADRCVMFLGCFPNLHFDHPVLSWFAFICVFLHCYAFPVEREPKRFFRKQRDF